MLHVVAPHGGTISVKGRGSRGLTVHKSLLTAQSVQYDAVVVADGPAVDQFTNDPFVGILLQEAYRHHKPIAAWGRGREVLARSVSHWMPTASSSRTASTTGSARAWWRAWAGTATGSADSPLTRLRVVYPTTLGRCLNPLHRCSKPRRPAMSSRCGPSSTPRLRSGTPPTRSARTHCTSRPSTTTTTSPS